MGNTNGVLNPKPYFSAEPYFSAAELSSATSNGGMDIGVEVSRPSTMGPTERALNTRIGPGPKKPSGGLYVFTEMPSCFTTRPSGAASTEARDVAMIARVRAFMASACTKIAIFERRVELEE